MLIAAGYTMAGPAARRGAGGSATSGSSRRGSSSSAASSSSRGKPRHRRPYRLDDPTAKHTRAAAKADQAGDLPAALASFQAAVQHESGPSAGGAAPLSAHLSVLLAPSDGLTVCSLASRSALPIGARQSNLGVCYMRLGRMADAEAAMKLALLARPVQQQLPQPPVPTPSPSPSAASDLPARCRCRTQWTTSQPPSSSTRTGAAQHFNPGRNCAPAAAV